MNYKSQIICLCLALSFGGIAQAESFLTAQSFPKTFDDVSFTDRMAVLADGYDDFDPEYDENGRCISGCAYRGMKLEDELAAIERNTEAARIQLEQYKLTHPEEFIAPQINMPPTTNTGGQTSPTLSQPSLPVAQQPNVQPSTPPPPSVTRTCAQYSQTIRPGMNAVIQAPLDGDLVISSDFGTRQKPCARCSSQHRGVDLRATVGTNVYTPANGKVVSVTSASSNCGNGVVIEHPDGYRTSYCHFSKVMVKVGDQVQGGCLIGQSGNTGASTGAHLHYAIKYNGTWVDPLYTDNRLGREYSFKPGTQQSKEHAGKKLPGKTN